MAALTGQSIASSYEQILHVDRDGGGNSTTLVSIKDGDNGSTFGFQISTNALMMTSTNQLQFGDTGTYIHQSADGVLDLVSDTELELNATNIDINGAVDISGTLTVSVDDTGADVRIYSATASEGLFYDASEDELGLLLTTKLKFHDIGGGEEIYASANGHLEINAGTTLDMTSTNIDMNGALDIDGTLTQDAGNVVFNEDSGDYDFRVESNGNANMLFVDGGNNRVGIGTASPTSIFDVQISSGASLLYEDSGEGLLSLINSSGSALIRLDARSSENNYINNGGNFGIGTASPASNLHILHTDADADAGPIVTLQRDNSAGEDNGDILGEIKFQGSDSANTITTEYSTIHSKISNVSNTVEEGTLVFKNMVAGSSTAVMNIAGNKVGISTASPAVHLHVVGEAGNPASSSTAQNGIARFEGTGLNSVLDIGQHASPYAMWLQAADKSNLAQFYNISLQPVGGNVGIGDSDPSEAKLSIGSVASGDYGLKIDNDQDTSAIFIDSEGTTAHLIAISSSTNTSGNIISIDNANALTSGAGISVESGGTALASTAAGGLVEIMHTGNSSSNVNNLLFVKNDDAGSTGTTALKIQQDAAQYGISIDQNGNNTALFIDSEQTSAYHVHMPAPVTTTGQIIAITDANALTSGKMLFLESNSASTTARNLAEIHNHNAAADAAVCLYLHQDGDDAHIEFAGSGGGGIKFNASAMSSANVNTLDDYEEGTWTPVPYFQNSSNNTSANANITTQVGFYTLIGNVMNVWCHLQFDLKEAAATDNFGVGGLPVATTSATNFQNVTNLSIQGSGITQANSYVLTHSVGESRMYLTEADGTGNQGVVVGENDGIIINFHSTYKI